MTPHLKRETRQTRRVEASDTNRVIPFGMKLVWRQHQFFLLLICVATALAASPSQLLPDGSLRLGTRVTIPAGQEREFLFRPEGVRFLSGRARIVAVGRPFIDPEGQEIKEFIIDVGKSPGVPWMHDEKPFRMRIHAETDFTLEARKSWEWTPEDEYKPL